MTDGRYFIKSVLCGFWLTVLLSAAQAQYRFDSWTTDNGLPQNSVNAILQTRDGYLWLATLNGLVRYNGARSLSSTRPTRRLCAVSD